MDKDRLEHSLAEAFEEVHAQIDVLSHRAAGVIDSMFIKIGNAAIKDHPFFRVISLDEIDPDHRPDAIRHDVALLKPNATSSEQIKNRLSLSDALLGDEAESVKRAFVEGLDAIDFCGRLIGDKAHPGQKLIVVSNHLELHDQGHTGANIYAAGNEAGYDRIENYLTIVVGILIGYIKFGEDNVIDDLLRNIGSVLKTYPSHGTETLNRAQRLVLKGLTLKGFVETRTAATKMEFSKLMSSSKGEAVCMAPSGEQDHLNPETGVVEMSEFSKGTNRMLMEASRRGGLILPLFVDYGSDASIVRFLPPRSVEDEMQCHQIGVDIASAGTLARQDFANAYPNVKRFRYPIKYTI